MQVMRTIQDTISPLSQEKKLQSLLYFHEIAIDIVNSSDSLLKNKITDSITAIELLNSVQ